MFGKDPALTKYDYALPHDEAKLVAIENDCNKKTSINKTLNIDLTGINDTEPGEITTVYPNPAGNTLSLFKNRIGC
ncbi:MAG: hypothetical protein GX128_10200 [Bacteroidales bacterium]|jgi:hypothetical protein|nr:hypothetical protein [Bacteroidales bacterium]